jgi:hypothetical protein
MTTRELQQELVKNVERWQKVENESVASTAQVMQKTENPVIRLVMEIIQRDSQMHYWVQRWIADTLTNRAVTLSPDELSQVWDMIKHHIDIEKKMVASAEEAVAAVKGKRDMLAQQYFLNYLLEDERKHNNLLDSLQILTSGMRDSD